MYLHSLGGTRCNDSQPWFIVAQSRNVYVQDKIELETFVSHKLLSLEALCKHRQKLQSRHDVLPVERTTQLPQLKELFK